MKKRLTLLSMLVIAIVAFGQEPAIVFETTKNPISLSIRASNDLPEAEEQVWIDLNGNGELDEGEKVTTFGTKVEYNVTTTTVRVFGPIFVFNCEKNDITSLDVSGAATTLNQLVFSNNQIESLDLSMMEKLSSTTTGTGGELKSLIPSPVQSRLNIYSNKLSLEAMTALVNELPDRTGKAAGSMTLWYGPGSVNVEGQNQLSQELYEILVSKNWEVKTAIPNAVYTGPFDITYPYLYPDTTEFALEQAGSSADVNLMSNVAWTVTVPADATWLTVDKTSGTNSSTLLLTAEENTTKTDRTAVITISSDDPDVEDRTITVTQSGTTTGIDNVGSVVAFYPNPVKDYLTIDSGEETQVTITDLSGKLVLKKTVFGKSQIDLSLIASGVYLIKLKDTTAKLIKN